MSTVDGITNLGQVRANTFEDRRTLLVDNKVKAAELVADDPTRLQEVSDALGLSPAFVQHYANNFKKLGASDFKTSVYKEELEIEKGFKAFVKQLLDAFKQAVEGR